MSSLLDKFTTIDDLLEKQNKKYENIILEKEKQNKSLTSFLEQLEIISGHKSIVYNAPISNLFNKKNYKTDSLIIYHDLKDDNFYLSDCDTWSGGNISPPLVASATVLEAMVSTIMGNANLSGYTHCWMDKYWMGVQAVAVDYDSSFDLYKNGIKIFSTRCLDFATRESIYELDHEDFFFNINDTIKYRHENNDGVGVSWAYEFHFVWYKKITKIEAKKYLELVF